MDVSVDRLDMKYALSRSRAIGSGMAFFTERMAIATTKGVTLLATSEAALTLAKMLVERGPLPQKAAADALHIAIAVTNGVEYLLTWNCKHIANANMRGQVERLCRMQGYEPTIICIPDQLWNDTER